MMTDTDSFRLEIATGIPENLPPKRAIDPSVDHAPSRPLSLDPASYKLAIENALRYFPEKWHSELSMEFAEELDTFGHIYMHRFRPRYPMMARPIDEYPCKTEDAAAILSLIHI